MSGSTLPPIPLTMEEMDHVPVCPTFAPRTPAYGEARILAWEMIRFDQHHARGLLWGCTFCSITDSTEGRTEPLRSVHPARSRKSVTRLHRRRLPDRHHPTANIKCMACKDPKIELSCRRSVLRVPGICENPAPTTVR